MLIAQLSDMHLRPEGQLLYDRIDTAAYLERAVAHVLKLDPAPDWSPERAETGTQNHEAIAGIGATIDFLASLAGDGGTRRERLVRTYETLHTRGEVQMHMLWDGLTRLPRVKVHGPPPSEPRTPTVSFTIDGIHPDDIARRLAASALFCSNGDFYAATCIERLGCPDGIVRVGCACYTTDDEVGRLVEQVSVMAD